MLLWNGWLLSWVLLLLCCPEGNSTVQSPEWIGRELELRFSGIREEDCEVDTPLLELHGIAAEVSKALWVRRNLWSLLFIGSSIMSQQILSQILHARYTNNS